MLRVDVPNVLVRSLDLDVFMQDPVLPPCPEVECDVSCDLRYRPVTAQHRYQVFDSPFLRVAPHPHLVGRHGLVAGAADLFVLLEQTGEHQRGLFLAAEGGRDGTLLVELALVGAAFQAGKESPRDAPESSEAGW